MTPAADRAQAVLRLEALGRCGVVVAVGCAPRADGGCEWAVTIARGDEGPHVLNAESFDQAIEVAALEALMRGWLTEDPHPD